MNPRKVCPNCRFSNVAQASFCGDCGRAFAGQGSQPATNMRADTERAATNAAPPNLRALETVATELDQLWGDFYKIRQHKKEGGFLWDFILKHIAAHDLDVKIDEVKGQIEDMWLAGYVESHNLPIQRILALQAQQIAHEYDGYQLQHEQRMEAQQFAFTQDQKDEELTRTLKRRKEEHTSSQELADAASVGKVGRFKITLDELERLLLPKPNDPNQDIKRELLLELTHLVKHDVFSSKGDGDGDYGSYLDELDDLINM